MDNLALAESRGQVDHAFLDAVEIEIEQALRRAADLEAGLGSFTVESDDSWQDAFSRLSSNLESWQDRLSDLTRQNTAIETDLNEQEHAMRSWFQALGVTSGRLAKASKR